MVPPSPPTQRLDRSAYEKVFLELGSLRSFKVGGETLTPVGVSGWYHAIFRTSSGEERLISIDQLLEHLGETP